MCEVCKGTGRVRAQETPRGWRCDGLNGPARVNRPKHVEMVFSARYGNVRSGMSECPLCARREIVETETDDFGFNVPLGAAPW